MSKHNFHTINKSYQKANGNVREYQLYKCVECGFVTTLKSKGDDYECRPNRFEDESIKYV